MGCPSRFRTATPSGKNKTKRLELIRPQSVAFEGGVLKITLLLRGRSR